MFLRSMILVLMIFRIMMGVLMMLMIMSWVHFLILVFQSSLIIRMATIFVLMLFPMMMTTAFLTSMGWFLLRRKFFVGTARVIALPLLLTTMPNRDDIILFLSLLIGFNRVRKNMDHAH
jgi:hypothetical protein